MSLEEERARQASSTATSGTPHLVAALPTVDEAIPSTPVKKEVTFDDVGMDDEDEEMRKALALSRGDDIEMEEAAGGEEEDDEEAEIARASESGFLHSEGLSLDKMILPAEQILAVRD